MNLKAMRESRGLSQAALADQINGLATEAYGDILLVEREDGYAVIEDYADFLQTLLRQQERTDDI